MRNVSRKAARPQSKRERKQKLKTLRLPLRLCAFARVISFVLLVAATSLAARIERGVDTWAPTHYLVDLKLNNQLTEITSASVRIYLTILKPTRVLDIDFGDLTIDRVTLNGVKHSYFRKDGRIHLALPDARSPKDSLVLGVEYHGKPKDGLILTNDKDGKPSAVGDNWPNRVHHWIPTLDHPSAKATVTFNITAPAAQEVVANGRLHKVETTADGQRAWMYTESVPIPPYCMIIAVGQFAKLEPRQRALTPLFSYVPFSDREKAVKGFAPAKPALEFFSEKVGPYPYEKLALIVGATRFGGMENSSAIVFTSTLFDRAGNRTSKAFGIPLSIVNLIAHEIAHQWFGDSVTQSTWSDLWLSEGFATYFAGLFIQRYEGEEDFQSYMKDAATRVFAFEKEKRLPIFDRDTEDLMELLNTNNYQKGSWVLHMLRSSLGDAAFFRGLRNYYEAHKNANATTEDLRAALEKASGRDLRWFFTRWIYEAGHPQYELTWTWVKKKELRLELKQSQVGNAFLDPVPITITTSRGPREIVLKPTGKVFTHTIPFRERPTAVELDPRNVLLDEATVKGS